MNDEELQIDLESEEFKADPAAYFNKLHNEQVSGLKSKRDELLQKVSGFKQVDTSELESLREFKSQADIQAEALKGNYDKALKMFEETQTAKLTELSTAKEQAEKTIEKLLIDNGLSAALDGVKIMPDAKEAATALFRSRAKLDGEQALIDGKPLSEAITEWAATDQGKFFIQAANNSGGGAQGSTSTTAKGKARGEMTPQDKAKFINENSKNSFFKLPA